MIKNIITGIILFSLLFGLNFSSVGNGQSITITKDESLSGFYNTITISGNGTPDNWIEVEGNNSVAKCLRITGQYITIKNIIVSGCSSHGVLITGKNVIFEKSNVYGTVTENGTLPSCNGSGGWGSAVKVQLGGENVIVRNNYVHDSCGEGIAVTRGINISIMNNYVKDNYSVNIYLDNSYNSEIYGNKVWCTGTALRNGVRPNGIAVAEENYSGWGSQRHDNKVINNYVTDCNDGIGSWNSENPDGSEIRLLISDNTINNCNNSIKMTSLSNQDVLIQNNIVEKQFFIKSNSGITLSGNIIKEVDNIIPNLIYLTETPYQQLTSTLTPSIVYTYTITQTQNPTSTSSPTFTKSPTPTSTYTLTKTPISTYTPTFKPITSTNTQTQTPTGTKTPTPYCVKPFDDIDVWSCNYKP